MRQLALLSPILLLLLVLAGCQAKEQPVKNVLLVTIDTLRGDALGFAGNREVETPYLDKLAAGGHAYLDAHSHNVVTLASHTNILTGLYPYQHGVRDNGGFKLRPEVPTLASILKARGFATGAFVGAYPLAARFGLGREFDVYDEVKIDKSIVLVGGLPDPHKPFGERPAAEVMRRATDWWRQQQGSRRFLWIHVFDPHSPYLPPEPLRARYAGKPYYGEIAGVDAELGKFFQGFLDGKEEDTVIVVTGDHGESLGEHGERAHSLFTYEATLHVPLLVWRPGLEPLRDEDWPARHVDILPTVLEAAGIANPSGDAAQKAPGLSLLAPRTEGPEKIDTYFEALTAHLNQGWAPLRGVLKDRKKYIEQAVAELYDLEQDPKEEKDLIDEQRRLARELAAALPAESKWPPDRGALSNEEIAELRSLGYLMSEAAKKTSYGPEEDLRKLAVVQSKMQEVVNLFHAGQLEKAMAICREVMAQRPDMEMAWLYLATSMIRLGRGDEAIAVLREAIAKKIESTDIRRQLGMSLLYSGKVQEGLTTLEALTREVPDVVALNNLALAYVQLERADAAFAALEKARVADPEDARTFENLAFVNLQVGRLAEAEKEARQAIALDPRKVGAYNNLALALYHQGKAREAVDTWSEASRLDPSNPDTLFNLASVAMEIGDRVAAGPALRRFLEVAPERGFEAQRQAARQMLAAIGGS
jgi:arylsulfatase A-like enzyme/Tfp pilus assembly protein PilF